MAGLVPAIPLSGAKPTPQSRRTSHATSDCFPQSAAPSTHAASASCSSRAEWRLARSRTPRNKRAGGCGSACVAFDEAVAMFVHAPNEIAGYADVDCPAGSACKDIKIELPHGPSLPKRDGRDKPGHDE